MLASNNSAKDCVLEVQVVSAFEEDVELHSTSGLWRSLISSIVHGSPKD